MSTEQRSVPSVSASGWRGERPVFGAGLLIIAGLLMLLTTWELTMGLLMIGGWFSVIGFLLGSLVILTGILTMVEPDLSTPLGVTGIGLSILAIIGALGGLLIGTVLGIVGGSLCVAWQPAPVRGEARRQQEAEPSKTKARSQSFTWQQTATSSTGEIGQDPDQGLPSATSTSSSGPSNPAIGGSSVSTTDEPDTGSTDTGSTDTDTTDDRSFGWQDDTSTSGSTGTGTGGTGSSDPSNPALGSGSSGSSFGGPTGTGSGTGTSPFDDEEEESDADDSDEDSTTFGWQDDEDEEETDN